MNNMQTNEKKTGMLLLLLCILFSCNSFDQDEYHESFDLPLLKKSDEYRFSGNYKDYIALQNKYFKIANDKGYEDGKALCYLELFTINQSLMNYEKSMYFLKKADSILSKSDDEVHKAMLYRAYGNNSYRLKLFDNSLYYNDKTLASLKKVRHKELKEMLLIGAYQRRASVYAYKTQFDSVYSSLVKAQKIREDFLTESSFIALYEQQNKVDSIAVHLDKIRNMIKNGKELSVSNLFLAHIFTGVYYSKSKRFDEADNEFKKALDLGNKFKGTSAAMINLYQILIPFYKEKGDLQKSEYYKNLYSVEKSKEENEMQRTINPAVNKFISDTSELETRSHRRMWILVSVLGILCVLIIIFAYRQLRIQKEKKKLLKNEAEILKGKIGDQKYDEMIALAKKNDPAFLVKFQEIYPEFTDKLLKINPDLETSELTFAALIKLNFSSKEIAAYTFIEHASVQQRKRRLRKRMNIPSEVDLYKYFSYL